MVFERCSNSHPALLANDANARAQELCKEPASIVIRCFYMVVGVFVKRLDMFGFGDDTAFMLSASSSIM